MVDIAERFIKLQLAENGESQRFEKYLREMISKGLIDSLAMRNFCLVKQMDDYIKANKGHIGNALMDLSDDFNVSERMIRLIHKKYTRIF